MWDKISRKLLLLTQAERNRECGGDMQIYGTSWSFSLLDNCLKKIIRLTSIFDALFLCIDLDGE